MIKLNLQFFGGSGSRLGGSTVRTGTSGASVSPTSTGGRLVNQGGGQMYGENDNGYSVSVLDGGSDPINEYRYGSRRIYEVHEYNPSGAQVGQTRYVPTKAEATEIAKKYLEETKNR